MTRPMLWLFACFLIACTRQTSSPQPVVPLTPSPSPTTPSLPAHLQHRLTYAHYATINRPNDTLPIFGDALQPMVRELYADPHTIAALRTEGRIPDGAQFVMETYLAKADTDGKPVRDAQGRLVKANLVVVESNTKHLRTNDTGKNWQPGFLDPQTGQPVPVNLSECTGCHRAAEDGSVYTLAALERWLATGQVQVLVCDKPNRLPCNASPAR